MSIGVLSVEVVEDQRMYSIWTKHLKDPDEKVQLEKSIKHNKWVLERLANILSAMEEDLDTAELNTKTYEIPNWDYRQAHNNGYRQCLRLIKKIINLDQKENNDRQSNQ